MPHVFPPRSRPGGAALDSHLPCRTKRSDSQIRRMTASMSPIARSATEGAITSGVDVTVTPREIINRLNSELNKVIAAPDMKEKMAANGVEPLGGTPEQFREYIRSESVRFGKVIRSAGIKGE